MHGTVVQCSLVGANTHVFARCVGAPLIISKYQQKAAELNISKRQHIFVQCKKMSPLNSPRLAHVWSYISASYICCPESFLYSKYLGFIEPFENR